MAATPSRHPPPQPHHCHFDFISQVAGLAGLPATYSLNAPRARICAGARVPASRPVAVCLRSPRSGGGACGTRAPPPRPHLRPPHAPGRAVPLTATAVSGKPGPLTPGACHAARLRPRPSSPHGPTSGGPRARRRRCRHHYRRHSAPQAASSVAFANCRHNHHKPHTPAPQPTIATTQHSHFGHVQRAVISQQRCRPDALVAAGRRLFARSQVNAPNATQSTHSDSHRSPYLVFQPPGGGLPTAVAPPPPRARRGHGCRVAQSHFNRRLARALRARATRAPPVPGGMGSH